MFTKKGVTLLLLLFLVLSFSTAFLYAESKRIALVVGNSNYEVSPLKNPVNDALAINNVLKTLGFSVILCTDADKVEIEKAVRDFTAFLSNNPNSSGLFFFAGHGLQVDGVNYLVPLKADIQDEYEVSSKAVNTDFILQKMEGSRNRLNIIILDACRNNPFAGSTRSLDRGLAVVSAPKGSIVVYATAPGTVSMDGKGSNGVFTEALLKYIGTPGINFESMLKSVRRDVVTVTKGKQIPWSHSSMIEDFYFVEGSAGTQIPALNIAPVPLFATANSGEGKIIVSTYPYGGKIFVNGLESGTGSALVNDLPLHERIRIEVKNGEFYGTKEIELLNPQLKEITINLKGTAAGSIVREKTAEPVGLRYFISEGIDVSLEGPGFVGNIKLYGSLKDLTPGDYELEILWNSGFYEKMAFSMIGEDTFELYKLTKQLRIVKIGNSQVLKDDFAVSGYEITNLQIKDVYNWAYMKGFIKISNGEVKNIQGQSQILLNLDSSDSQIEFNNGIFHVKDEKDYYPCVEVSWYGAVAFCNFLSQMELYQTVYNFNDWSCNWNARGYRLPTEEEWEYAALGGQFSKGFEFSGSNKLDNIGWYFDNSGVQTHRVGEKDSNELGVFDMSGNVIEWCWDWYGNRKSATGPIRGTKRVVRGGSVYHNPEDCTSTQRLSMSPTKSFAYVGFRIILPLE